MSAPETVADVTAEMRRIMPNACGDWADRIDRAARPSADTLRDYFAGRALAGMNVMSLEGWTNKDIALQAYSLADHMLAAR